MLPADPEDETSEEMVPSTMTAHEELPSVCKVRLLIRALGSATVPFQKNCGFLCENRENLAIVTSG